jgi:PEP-CTERM motif
MEILSPTCVRVLRGTPVRCLSATIWVLLALVSPALAVSYDASVFLSISAGPNPRFGTSLTFFPGITVTPPPTTFGNGSATRSASASVPGQVSASASGSIFICQEIFGCGEQPSFSIASSGASATGVGSLVVQPQFHQNNVNFPLVIREDWRLASDDSRAAATIRYTVLLDGELLRSANRTVAGGFTEVHATTPLTLNVAPGFHSVVFTAEASGLAAIPEPTTMLLFGSSLAAIGLAARRRRKHQQS